MRIVKFLFTAVFIILLLFGSGFLIFRETLLLTAGSQIKVALKTLRKIKRDPTSYYYQCREKGGDVDEAVPEVFQLKFNDDKNYQLEVICRQFPLDPIIIDQYELPFMVSKAKGGSGIIWGNAESSLGLEILGRKTSIIVKNEKVNTASFKADFGSTPLASCQGYGYKCCQEETSMGAGEQLFGTSDCPRSCFDSCVSRPVILSFTSDPFYETKSRTVTIKKNEVVNFSYVVDPGAEDIKSVQISFGDGEEHDFIETTGRISHTYLCSKSVCSYEASIMATDTKNVDSANTGVAKIVVKVE
ncbi:MAG: hypothetical protein ABFQ62_01870 [Patescibacteria group bacterium]